MMIDFGYVLTKNQVTPKGIIQVGSHWAEENDVYVKLGVRRMVYIEPCLTAFKRMLDSVVGGLDDLEVSKLPQTIYDLRGLIIEVGSVTFVNCACGSVDSELPMYVSHQNQGQSNSLLKPNLHLEQHPEIVFDDAEVVKVVPLDSLPIKKDEYNILVMDVQGFEGEVLKGATETLKHIDLIYTEVNRGQTYEGNMEINEMDLFLADHGFSRVETFWPSPNWTWGDAVYIKNKNK